MNIIAALQLCPPTLRAPSCSWGARAAARHPCHGAARRQRQVCNRKSRACMNVLSKWEAGGKLSFTVNESERKRESSQFVASGSRPASRAISTRDSRDADSVRSATSRQSSRYGIMHTRWWHSHAHCSADYDSNDVQAGSTPFTLHAARAPSATATGLSP